MTRPSTTGDARPGITLADVGEWEEFGNGASRRVRGVALDVLAVVHEAGTKHPAGPGWRVWRPAANGYPGDLFASGPETGEAGRAKADEALRALLGAPKSGPAGWSAEVEAEAGRVEPETTKPHWLHPSDCQSCSEDDEPCSAHAEDWRYWQGRALDALSRLAAAEERAQRAEGERDALMEQAREDIAAGQQGLRLLAAAEERAQRAEGERDALMEQAREDIAAGQQGLRLLAAAEERAQRAGNILATLVRDIDRGSEERPPWAFGVVARLGPDHACAECVPHSDVLVPGFQCGLHAARALVAGGAP